MTDYDDLARWAEDLDPDTIPVSNALTGPAAAAAGRALLAWALDDGPAGAELEAKTWTEPELAELIARAAAGEPDPPRD